MSSFSDLIGYIYFSLDARSTANSAYFTPFSPDVQPYPMSTWITSAKLWGNFTVFFDTDLSMVVTSPKDRIGSLSIGDKWKLSRNTVFRWGSMLSVLRYPMLFLKSSIVIVFTLGSADRGLSMLRT